MAMGNLRSRNASTALGLVWWVLNPLLMGLVYYVVFGIILDVSRDLSYLLSGIFVFYYTSTSVSYTHLTLPTRSCQCRSGWSP